MKNKYKKIGFIILGLIGIILIIVGVVNKFDFNDGDSKEYEEESKVKKYSKYGNYTLNVKKIYGSNTKTTSISRVIDVDCNNNKIRLYHNNTNGVFETIYYDFNNNVQYASNLDGSYSKIKMNKSIMYDFSDVISNVSSFYDESNDGIYTYMGTYNNELKEYKDVFITVELTEDGYLKTISYDLANKVDDYTVYKITYEFNNINSIDSVVIPNDVINSSKTGNNEIMLDY